MQAGGRFVEDVERSAGVAFGEFEGEFDALGFAAGEGGGGLAEADVAEAYVHQGLQFARYGGDGVEKFAGFFDGHVEDLADVFAFVLDFEGFAVVAFAVADFAGDVHVGQEVHFDFNHAVALAGFAAAAFDVEGESADVVAAFAREGDTGEEFADGGEQAGIGGGVGARGAADGGLVDVDDFVEVFEAVDVVVWGGFFLGAVEFAGGDFGEGVVNQGGFAAAGYAGDAGNQTERQFEGNVFEVVAARSFEDEHPLGIDGRAFRRHGIGFFAAEVLSGNGFFALGDVFGRVGNQYVAAVFACAGTHIDDKIGFADGVFVVFDHNHAVAQVAQAFEGGEQAVVVALVQADGGFVQNVHYAGQSAADLTGEADALGFATGKGFGGAGEIQVIQSDVDQEAEPLGDFFEDFFGDLFFVAVQIQRFKELVGFGQRPGGNFV